MKKPSKKITQRKKESKPQAAVVSVQTVIPDVVPENVAVIEQATKLAKAAVQAAQDAMGKYWEFVTFARANALSPLDVTNCLRAAGFAETRISEVKKVVAASDKVFADYEARRIGFRLALQRSREEGGRKVRTQRTDAQIFEAEFVELMERFIPVTGEIPDFVKKSYRVNGKSVAVHTSSFMDAAQ